MVGVDDLGVWSRAYFSISRFIVLSMVSDEGKCSNAVRRGWWRCSFTSLSISLAKMNL